MSTDGKIKTNGHNGNGNGAVSDRIAKESVGFMVAEGASMVTSLGVIAVADQIIPKSVMKGATQVLGKLIEPFLLDPLEKGMGTLCKLDECKMDSSKPREERAEDIAKTLMIFGAAFVLSMQVKLHTRRFMNKTLHVVEELPKALPKTATFLEKVKHTVLFRHWSPEEKMIFLVDEGVHLGSLFCLNNPLAPYTDDMIRSTSGIIQKLFGTNQKKAHEISTMAWVWEVPNVLGGLAGIGAIAAKQLACWPKPGWLGKPRESHVEKLAQNTALTSTMHTGI